MRRIYAAFGILAAIFALALYSTRLVKTTTERLCQGLDAVEAACVEGRYQEAAALVRQLNNYYAKQEHQLALFIKRDFLSGAAGALAGLEAYTQKEYLPDLQSEARKARAQIEAVRHLFFSML